MNNQVKNIFFLFRIYRGNTSLWNWHCVKIVSYSGPHFPPIFLHSNWYLSAFSPNAGKCGKNADQSKSEYGHYLRRVNLCLIIQLMLRNIYIYNTLHHSSRFIVKKTYFPWQLSMRIPIVTVTNKDNTWSSSPKINTVKPPNSGYALNIGQNF